ncbi:adenylate/guanylate cyclase domain-containing protein [Sinorhizobium numidicum]|uniref:Adenylate/guanylate cyclase domain-containing protein n=1 Tax=Sinorhizobium numidicum TaxID=680248 RepID=A0ABY8CTF9_9HYPH|nr:adenylate/guanylate cyclase domain-containing protein [Sinorhizobium numidicum]WEX78532.1 adenylate/guanylate cyclase domain-containing protein [Sinorhizobium numidicum]WEX81929.1 adenylate/guanylate cyclase domain-containing protein [Sinorhizobium numidicum]
MRWRFSTLEIILLLLIVAGSGVAYAWAVYGDGWLIGATYAVFICMPVLAFERHIIFRRLYRRIHGLSTPGFLFSSVVVYFAIENVGFAAAGLVLNLAGLLQQSWSDAMMPSLNVLLYALAISGPIIFVLRVRELLGRDVFLSLLTGRYRKPMQEERVFLFVDLAGSTSFAERFGDLRMQEYLSRLFATLADPVLRYGASIHDYVGDAAVITWRFDRAVADAACIRCVFDILDQIDENAHHWRKEYGEVPRLRAALHGGMIVAAEIGVDKHKITYFGDTVNTTARLEGFCRTLDRQVLISADLLRRMRLPAFVRSEDLGEHEVKGRGQRLGVHALARGLLRRDDKTEARISTVAV